jgi:hypothetical protein
MIMRTFIVALVVVFVASLFPRWVGYAAIGLTAGVVVNLLVRLLRYSPGLRWGLVLVIVLCGTAFMLWLHRGSLSVYMEDRRLPLIVEVNYTASIEPQADRSRWQVREEFLASDQDSLSDHSVSKAEVRQVLRQEGWESSGFVGSSEQFQRTRDFEAVPHLFPATTTLEIPIEIVHALFPASRIRFVPDSKSTAIITSPKYVVASTFPACSSRSEVLHGGREKLTVPLAFSRLEQPVLRLALLSPLLRWPLGPRIGSLSLWSGVQWLLLAVCAVFSGQIKEKLLKPILARLFSSKKATTSKKNDKEETQEKNA